MDGTSKTYIATAESFCLTIDYIGKVFFLNPRYFFDIEKWLYFVYLTLTLFYCMNLMTIIASRLYWTDELKNTIESSDVNGGNRQVLAIDIDVPVMDLVNQGHFLYYTARSLRFVLLLKFINATQI